MSFYNKNASRDEALNFFTEEGVLTFGSFTLKSGRSSPYFFNTGSLCTGYQLNRLGKLYARALHNVMAFSEATVVFGSAYKGIPISVATVMAMEELGNENLRAVSDRKEAKTHGDVSGFLGILQRGDKAVIVDDVITTGGTKIEAIEKLRAAGCEPLGLIIAFDRGEPVDESGRTAREIFQEQTGLEVHALLTVHDIIEARPDLGETLKAHLASFA
jgi:orotate phosphoribosyltransferase